jgi:hypothetical protein
MGKISGSYAVCWNVGRKFGSAKGANIVEDQDRKTPEEEKEVEAHALQDFEAPADFEKQGDDVEAHALQDFEAPADFEKQGDDVEAHALRDFEDFTDFERSGEGDKKDFE